MSSLFSKTQIGPHKDSRTHLTNPHIHTGEQVGEGKHTNRPQQGKLNEIYDSKL